MINLSSQMCELLGLTYWQLQASNEDNSTRQSLSISREEKELLRKILLAKGIHLDDEMIEIKPQDIIIVHLPNHQLVFGGVDRSDQKQVIYLAKIVDMLSNQEQKKLTWYKLKNLDL